MTSPNQPQDSEMLELASVCSQWLERDIDMEELSADEIADAVSSNSGMVGDHTTTPQSSRSLSTAFTSPFALYGDNKGSDQATEQFMQGLTRADLPSVSKKAFGDLACDIESLAALLSFGDRTSPQLRKDIKTHMSRVHSRLSDALKKVQAQINQIDGLKSLAPFNVVPKPEDLWCNYRQKAFLILRNTSLPCVTEGRLIRELAFLFNEHVYIPFLQSLEQNRFQVDVEDGINETYDTMLRLLRGYKQWCREMKDIRKHHMLPVLRAILDSPALVQDIVDFEANIEAMKAVTRETCALSKEAIGGVMASQYRVRSPPEGDSAETL